MTDVSIHQRPYTLRVSVAQPYAATVERVRSALAEVGFGVITEIDMAATMKAKLGIDMAPQVILGACRPALAHQALQADPSVATLLPCNVVVRADGEQATLVEAIDPAVMTEVAGAAMREVAQDAAERLGRLLSSLTAED